MSGSRIRGGDMAYSEKQETYIMSLLEGIKEDILRIALDKDGAAARDLEYLLELIDAVNIPEEILNSKNFKKLLESSEKISLRKYIVDVAKHDKDIPKKTQQVIESVAS